MKINDTKNLQHKNKKRIWVASIAGLLLVLLLIFIGSIRVGRYPISLGEIVNNIYLRIIGQSVADSAQNVIFDMRLPRIFAAILAGASLSGAGAAFQGIFKNPMVSPDILGASAGASCGAALAILLSLPVALIPILAFFFGLIAVFFSYLLSTLLGKSRDSTLILVLCGMVVANLFTAGISIIKFVADPNSKLPEITFWLMGGLASVTKKDVIMLLVPFLIGAIILLLMRWRLNIMTFGEEEASALGVDTRNTRIWVIFSATLITAASVAVSGMVGWVGLIIPHLARRVVGPDFRIMLPTSMLMGAAFLLLVDDVARSIYTTEIPISILTSIIGAPLFVILLLRQKRGAE